MSDIIIRATGKRAPLRFVLVSIKNTMNEIGAKHNAQNFALKLMAETAAASLLLSSGLKFPGTVSLRIDIDGDLRLAQADSTPQGLLRAMVQQEDIARLGANEPLLTPQKLSVIKLNEKSQRVKESMVEAPSMQMGENLTAYMLQSEQTKSTTGILADFSKENSRKLNFAIGFLIEAYPDAEARDLEIMNAAVRNLPNLKDFYDGSEYKIHDLLDGLRGSYEIDIVKEVVPQAYCPCSKEKVLASLEGLHDCEIRDIRQKDETLDVVCDFCRAHYAVKSNELRSLATMR
ncbi:MAG: Hsp33 family molecular chaperone HslO [Fibromonadaceae bacterium]|jgi:molecular chaperone Hsp33|nr:Hsp33 family molecular chaperone HslO [Fibromonadaceae bacterium]